MKTKELKKLNLGDIERYRYKFLNDDTFFSKRRIEISKTFLSYFLDVDVYTSTFEEIRNNYIQQYNNKISEEEKEFYYEIAQRFLYLEKEPKEVLLEYYLEATKDLLEIDVHLKYIEKESSKIKDKKQNEFLNGEDRYYQKLLQFYKEKNLIAQNEIVDYLSNRIKKHTLEACSPLYFAQLALKVIYRKMPYQYSKLIVFGQNENTYDVRNLTDISNKFDELYVQQHSKIRDLYDNNLDGFYETAEYYILGDKNEFICAIKYIRDLTSKSHILKKKYN